MCLLNFFISTVFHWNFISLWDIVTVFSSRLSSLQTQLKTVFFRNIAIRCQSCLQKKVQLFEVFKYRSEKRSRFPEGSNDNNHLTDGEGPITQTTTDVTGAAITALTNWQTVSYRQADMEDRWEGAQTERQRVWWIERLNWKTNRQTDVAAIGNSLIIQPTNGNKVCRHRTIFLLPWCNKKKCFAFAVVTFTSCVYFCFSHQAFSTFYFTFALKTSKRWIALLFRNSWQSLLIICPVLLRILWKQIRYINTRRIMGSFCIIFVKK